MIDNSGHFKYKVVHTYEDGHETVFNAGETSLVDALDREIRYVARANTRQIAIIAIERRDS